MVEKRLLVPERLRKTPGSGFSWVDRRFLPDHASGLSREAILLYFFLAAVSDKLGVSFYGDAAIAARLKLDPSAIAGARDELVRLDLVAHAPPLTQVLSLPAPRVCKAASEAETLGSIFRRLGERP